nr:myosin heavy chain-related protein [Tanacetum cinerariifolium]
ALDANEEFKKAHTRVYELEKQVEKLPMEFQSKNNFKEALETMSKDLEKKRLDLKPMLHDLQKLSLIERRNIIKPNVL